MKDIVIMLILIVGVACLAAVLAVFHIAVFIFLVIEWLIEKTRRKKNV